MRNTYQAKRTWTENHGQIPKGYHIHHIDGDKTNNNIDNLLCLSPEMHFLFHEDRYIEMGLGKDYAAMRFLAKDSRRLDNYDGPMKGRNHSDETKRKISESKKGKASGRKGKKMTEAQKKLISDRTKLAMQNPDVKKKISDAAKGRVPWNKGIKQEDYKKKDLN